MKKPIRFINRWALSRWSGENENALFFPTKSIELLFTQSD